MANAFLKQIADHLRQVHFGGNWTYVNLKDTLDGIDWELATRKLDSFNTIAGLVYHIHYYIVAITGVLENNQMEAKDKYSFSHPPITSAEDWNKMKNRTWSGVEKLAGLIEVFPEEKLYDTFVKDIYGNYLRNFIGVTEHAHYHLGQIVLLKKLLLGRES